MYEKVCCLFLDSTDIDFHLLPGKIPQVLIPLYVYMDGRLIVDNARGVTSVLYCRTKRFFILLPSQTVQALLNERSKVLAILLQMIV